ncbi:MAG TPA: hypothetical protein VFG42_05070 [Baekduia sp.]|uniref:COG4705 family protein n=1 Tax=Baekduia sp. TaxID=2600305 RepID=UPI002D778CB9|nr:hypothetical protein [Baekduia sp.]HET6506137.1 hypothetical protein [Baekduia sp.]
MSQQPTATAGRRPALGEPLAAKVPEITVLFWVVKVLTTGIGESASDFLGQISVPLAGTVGLLGLVLALRFQLRAPAYHAPTYWIAVLMVAVFGTMAADGVHDGTGMPYSLTTAFYALVVAGIFVAWHRGEGTVDIHSITTRRRERFYWAAVLATFALGTAAGDLTAMPLHLGFLSSGLLFAAIIAVPAVAWWRLNLNPVVAFWAAYVVTRPLGASFADWLGKPHAQTGVGLGDGVVTGLGLVAFAALVAYTARTRHGVQEHAPHRHPAPAPQPVPAEA